jgi:hypothetical protein
MASRKDPVARARGRKPAPVKKPFPWGFAVGSLALVLFLGGILTYAALNVSLGDKSSIKAIQHSISGLHNSKGLSENHIDGKLIDYPDQDDTPPDGGNHNPTWQTCQVYTAPIANEHAVHSLEHGTVRVTYNPDKQSTADVAALKKAVGDDPYHMMSPYPGLKSPISLQAWGEQLFVDKVSDSRIQKFMTAFTQGPQTPEKGASCTGGTTDDRTTADKAFSGHASASGKPAGAEPPGSTPMPTAGATATAQPAATASAQPTKK